MKLSTHISIAFATFLPFATLAAEPPAGTLIVHPADGARMVYVPVGKFIMGLDEAEANTVAQHLGAKDAATLWAWVGVVGVASSPALRFPQFSGSITA